MIENKTNDSMAPTVYFCKNMILKSTPFYPNALFDTSGSSCYRDNLL